MDRYEEQRKVFEEVAYERYLVADTEGRAKAPGMKFLPTMTPEQFLAREEDGSYAVKGLDGAWWGWQTHNEMMLKDGNLLPEPVRVVVDAFCDINKELITYLQPQGTTDVLVNAILALVDNSVVATALKRLGRL